MCSRSIAPAWAPRPQARSGAGQPQRAVLRHRPRLCRAHDRARVASSVGAGPAPPGRARGPPHLGPAAQRGEALPAQAGHVGVAGGAAGKAGGGGLPGRCRVHLRERLARAPARQQQPRQHQRAPAPLGRLLVRRRERACRPGRLRAGRSLGPGARGNRAAAQAGGGVAVGQRQRVNARRPAAGAGRPWAAALGGGRAARVPAPADARAGGRRAAVACAGPAAGRLRRPASRVTAGPPWARAWAPMPAPPGRQRARHALCLCRHQAVNISWSTSCLWAHLGRLLAAHCSHMHIAQRRP